MASVFTLQRALSRRHLRVRHELDSRDAALVFLEEPDARAFHSDVPDPGCRVVRAGDEYVPVEREDVEGQHLVLVVAVLEEEAAGLLQVPEHYRGVVGAAD